MINTPNFEAPIPGQSLTGEPKARPYENPPRYNTPEEAIQFYMDSLTRQEVLDDLFLALEEGFPLNILVKSIVSTGVMEGIHSLDVSLIIAPAINEYILEVARGVGIKVVERPVSKDERLEKKEKATLAGVIERSLEKSPKKDLGREMLEEALEFVQSDEMEEEPEEEAVVEEPVQEEPMGLMSRRGA